MIHCAADLRIRQLGNFTSTILRKTRAALTTPRQPLPFTLFCTWTATAVTVEQNKYRKQRVLRYMT